MFITPIKPMQIQTEIPSNQPIQSKPASMPFQDILQDVIANARETEAIAKQDAIDLALGNTDDIHNIMINAEKAAIALELTVQMTSKAVNAYNEIMRMQL